MIRFSAILASPGLCFNHRLAMIRSLGHKLDEAYEEASGLRSSSTFGIHSSNDTEATHYRVKLQELASLRSRLAVRRSQFYRGWFFGNSGWDVYDSDLKSLAGEIERFTDWHVFNYEATKMYQQRRRNQRFRRFLDDLKVLAQTDPALSQLIDDYNRDLQSL